MSNLDRVNQLLAEDDSSSEDDDIANLTQNRTIDSLIGHHKPGANRISAPLKTTNNLLARSAIVPNAKVQSHNK